MTGRGVLRQLELHCQEVWIERKLHRHATAADAPRLSPQVAVRYGLSGPVRVVEVFHNGSLAEVLAGIPKADLVLRSCG